MQVYEPHSGAYFDVAISGPDNGPLVILIHGSLDRASGMARLGRVCSQHRQVARYDRRGYSERWEHTGPLNVDGNVDDIASFIGEKSAILIGHSYGGQIALAAASRLGHQIVGVSTYETPLSWMPWWPSNTAGAAGVQAGPTGAAEQFMIRMIGQARWESLPERTKTERRREGKALVAELQALRQGPSWLPTEIQCPTICGLGSHAKEHHQRAVSWMVQEISHATATTIDGADHGAHMSHPNEFYEQLIGPHIQGTGTLTVTS